MKKSDEELREERIELAEYRSESAKQRAVQTLLHYFQLAGAPTGGDCGVEIAGIVEDIVEAAVAAVEAKLLAKAERENND